PGTPGAIIRLFLRRYRLRIGAGVLLLILTNALALWIPRLLKLAVDAMGSGAPASAVVRFALTIVAVAAAQSVVRTGSRLAILGMSRLVTYDLRNILFSHLQRLPLAWFRGRSTGDVVSRAINDVTLVRSFFGPGVMNLANTTLTYVGAILLMASMSPRLTLYALSIYPIFAIAVNRMSKRVYTRVLDAQERLATLTNKAQENISGMALIKTYVREEEEAAAFERISADYMTCNLALSRARGAMVPLMGMMAHAGTIVIIFAGGRRIIGGQISLGDFVAFNAYLAFLLWPTFAFGWILNTFQRGLAAMRRIGEILSEPPEIREAPGEGESLEAGRPFRGDIEFRDLTYAHAGAPDGVAHLTGISERIRAGEVVGILGTVGSGKTTLVNLLPRILEPPPGTVFIDGQDVTGIPLFRLRRHIAVVPQEPFLFSRSVRRNVAYAPRVFSEEAILDAVEVSRLSKDIPSLPRGIESIVGERGFILSGGQRQRATLARAVITAPSILILDDPLSSVDAGVEEEMLRGLRETAKGRTVLLISNRVAALAWADRILVLDEGRLAESGTHEELMRGGGLYAAIARQQSLASRHAGI
ncbi:MAG TPA: ABC transporter ATP-binding protein, partial [Candidatus Saccharimonadales bacterium]|nr:ABC transporter ATP-binding protein [Candidatus Saccharimonadales bacterium]